MNNVSHYRMEKTEREHRKSRVRTKGKEPREIEAPFVIFCFFCVFQRTYFSAQRFIVSGQPFLYGLSEKGTE